MTGRTRLSDTSSDADEKQFEIYRGMSAAEKISRVRELTRTACLLALNGLRERYPGADERELLLRLAVLRFGDELVRRAYGWSAHDGT